MTETSDPILEAARAAYGEPRRYCSFCGTSQADVRKLMAGPTVYICDTCTMLCTEACMDGNPLQSAMHLTNMQELKLGELNLTAREALQKAFPAGVPPSDMSIGQLLHTIGRAIYQTGIEQQLIDPEDALPKAPPGPGTRAGVDKAAPERPQAKNPKRPPSKKLREATRADFAVVARLSGLRDAEYYQARDEVAAELGLTTSQVGTIRMHIRKGHPPMR